MTRLKTSRQSRRIHRNRLRLEALEARLPLAAAAFTVELYEDLGGVPGNLIVGDTVEVGDSFFLEIKAQEFDLASYGLRGVALDIAWDPSVIREIDEPFDPRKLVTSQLPASRSGTLDNAAGTIDNLAGACFLAGHVGWPIGNLGPERFALLRFRALSEAEGSLFSMREGRSSITQVPVSSLNAEHLYFEPQTITVVAAQMPAESESQVTVTIDEPATGPLGPTDTDESLAAETQTPLTGSDPVDPDPPPPADETADADIPPTPQENADDTAEQPVADASVDSSQSSLDEPVTETPDAPPPTDNEPDTDQTSEPAVGPETSDSPPAQQPSDEGTFSGETRSAIWQNPDNPYDVNGIDGVTPLDALLIVNYINRHIGEPVLPSVAQAPPPFYDVNGDNLCTAHDMLLVINFLLPQANSASSNEAAVADAPVASGQVSDCGTVADLASDPAQATCGSNIPQGSNAATAGTGADEIDDQLASSVLASMDLAMFGSLNTAIETLSRDRSQDEQASQAELHDLALIDL